MTILNINKLCVSAPKSQQLLLDDISCKVVTGEILAVVGPNGAGKSTLLHTIAGDIQPLSGEIALADIPQSLSSRAKHVAVLPQFSLLNFPYRVAEVVQLGRIPHNTGQTLDRQIISQVLELMDISYLSDRLYTELSGGEKQRVQLARVMAQIWRAEDAGNGQRILLLDEPTTALDLGHQHSLMHAIQKFSASGVIVVMVLHDLNLAARYADKILALLSSRAIAFGTTNEVITGENIEKLFATKVSILQHPNYSTPIVIGL